MSEFARSIMIASGVGLFVAVAAGFVEIGVFKWRLRREAKAARIARARRFEEHCARLDAKLARDGR